MVYKFSHILFCYIKKLFSFIKVYTFEIILTKSFYALRNIWSHGERRSKCNASHVLSAKNTKIELFRNN